MAVADDSATRSLTTQDLDGFASAYYLADGVEDLDVEGASHTRSMRWVVDALRPARRVLELGYGSGWTTPLLVAAGFEVDVVEGSSLLCQQARAQLGPGVGVLESMFEDLTAPQAYDAVLAQHVLEHVDDPVALLRHMRTWLRPDGRLVAVVPNSESLHRRLAVHMGLQATGADLSPRDVLVGHQRVYDLPWLRRDLEAAGFVVEREFGYFLKTVANAQMLDWSPALVAALSDVSGELPPALLANIGVVAQPL